MAMSTGAASAVPFLEDAADLYSESGGAFESSVTRVALAQCLLALERREAANRELDRAIATFQALGAEHHLARALALRATPKAGAPGNGANGLTPRELEVLSLVADGKSNADIAETLVLSIRTVERHLATVYEKLDLDGRNARAAAVSYALRHGLIRN